MSLLSQINTERLPNHIAIIMDGNGRWAKNKGLLRNIWHRNGAKTVKEVVETCAKIDIKYLTLYAFSNENWSRPKLEVELLMKLLISSLKKEVKTLQKNNIKLTTIGNINSLPTKVANELKDVVTKTKDNKRLTLTLALSYGSREELIKTIKEISLKVKNNLISPENIDKSVINNHLYDHYLPDVDLLIRTSGEQRISNFLLLEVVILDLLTNQSLQTYILLRQ